MQNLKHHLCVHRLFIFLATADWIVYWCLKYHILFRIGISACFSFPHTQKRAIKEHNSKYMEKFQQIWGKLDFIFLWVISCKTHIIYHAYLIEMFYNWTVVLKYFILSQSNFRKECLQKQPWFQKIQFQWAQIAEDRD